jgi:hypothetical protein
MPGIDINIYENYQNGWTILSGNFGLSIHCLKGSKSMWTSSWWLGKLLDNLIIWISLYLFVYLICF